MWPVWLYHIFSHYLTRDTSFRGKELLKIKCVCFDFSTKLFEIFLILRRNERDVIISLSNHQIFEKYWNLKFHENLLSGTQVFLCGRTDRQIDITKLIVAFRNFATAFKNHCYSPTYFIYVLYDYRGRTTIFSLSIMNWLAFYNTSLPYTPVCK